MSTIGVGRALRQQQKAGARRERGERSKGNTDLELDQEVSPCVKCDSSVAACDMFGTEEGGVCASCYVEYVDVPSKQTDRRFEALVTLVGTWMIPAMMAFYFSVADWAAFSGKGGMGWVVLISLGVVFGGLGSMHSARLLRDSMYRVSLDEEEEGADSFGVVLGGFGLGAGVLAVIFTLLLGAAPYIGFVRDFFS